MNKNFSSKKIINFVKRYCFEKLYLNDPLFLKIQEKNTFKKFEEKKMLIANCVVSQNKIVFINYQKDFCGNSAFIANELLKRKLNLDIVFVVYEKNLNKIPQGMRGVVTTSNEHYKELLTAKIWVDNAFECIFSSIPKKDEQIYINTWHATAGFKDLNNERKGLIDLSRSMVDYILASSKIDEKIFKYSIWSNSKILTFGNPKNDQLFSSINAKEKVTKYFDIPYNSKIILYAPTFRDITFDDNNNKSKASNPYIKDFRNLRKTINKKLGNNVYFLVRTHHKDSKDQNEFLESNMRLSSIKNSYFLEDNMGKSDYILNSNSYDNIEEIIISMDMGISDYSSWVNQAMLLYKPIFLYTKDIDNYTRGFAYDLSSTPFSLAKDIDQLHINISNFSLKDYQTNCKKYIQKFGFIKDNKSSERTVDFILDLLSNRE